MFLIGAAVVAVFEATVDVVVAAGAVVVVIVAVVVVVAVRAAVVVVVAAVVVVVAAVALGACTRAASRINQPAAELGAIMPDVALLWPTDTH